MATNVNMTAGRNKLIRVRAKQGRKKTDYFCGEITDPVAFCSTILTHVRDGDTVTISTYDQPDPNQGTFPKDD